MNELGELYQQVILDHNRAPRNFGKLADANAEARGVNPLCGDKLTIYLKLAKGKVAAIRWEGDGCAISKASASTMSEAVAGRSKKEIESLFSRFHALVTGEGEREGDGRAEAGDLGKLQVFEGVREFPMRVKCATLAWHTLREAMSGGTKPVTTE